MDIIGFTHSRKYERKQQSRNAGMKYLRKLMKEFKKDEERVLIGNFFVCHMCDEKVI